LQCNSALYTWKICFAANRNYHELILSACSSVEGEQWQLGLKAGHANLKQGVTSIPTAVSLDLRSVGPVFLPAEFRSDSIRREHSVQRAATVGNRTSMCQVIIRNTHNVQDLQDFRHSPPAINRSQSHATANKVVVLAPKRSERARMETMLSEVWTKDKLPYPGMIASRGGQIIRASAGSLVRKLSFASMHAPFSRRSGSSSLTSKRSYDAFVHSKKERPMFEVKRDSFDETPPPIRKRPHDLPELDSMNKVIERMIGPPPSRASLSACDVVVERPAKGSKDRKASITAVGPDSPAHVFYKDEETKVEKEVVVGVSLGKKKRWSNPIGMLMHRSADGFRHMLYSSR